MKSVKELYPGNRFFYAAALLVLWFLFAFFIPVLYTPGLYALILFAAFIIYESVTLLSIQRHLKADRQLPVRLSLADPNHIKIELSNHSDKDVNYMLTDELPVQLQVRDFLIRGKSKQGKTDTITYSIRPAYRGEYAFGSLIILISSGFHLMRFRKVFPLASTVPVFPSFIRQREFSKLQHTPLARTYGFRNIRRIGQSYEFEQIRNYVAGDDIRQINWKATARQAELMVNLFQEERSQSVYNIIDKGRNMLMPFEGLSLMDHAINATMAISGTILSRQDMAGLITFSDKIGTAVRAERRTGQMTRLAELLYRQHERETESDFEMLYFAVRNMIKTRSLLFLYTNFESIHAFRRALPVLRKIAGKHLLMVVFFRNTEIAKALRGKTGDTRDMYRRILATQMMQEKETMALELKRMGIGSVLCEPQELSLAVLNSYKEIKARGKI